MRNYHLVQETLLVIIILIILLTRTALLIYTIQEIRSLGIIRKDHAAIFSRLDHAMANFQWICLYPSIVVEHLPIIGSDHGPILNNTMTHDKPQNFKFETKWLLDEKFMELVKSVWTFFTKGSSAF